MGYSYTGTSGANSGSAAKQSPCGNGGGSKKQGLVHSNFRYYNVVNFIKSKAEGTPLGRQTVYAVNMLGGVGRGKSQFGQAGLYRPDGARRFAPFVLRCNSR